VPGAFKNLALQSYNVRFVVNTKDFGHNFVL